MIWDHPRACGAHDPGEAEHDEHPGLSPRMRGSRIRFNPLDGKGGIIPAHAGLTRRR